MDDEAAKVEQRCDVETSSDGVKTAITGKARETKAEVNDFMKTYLEDAEALDGLEFLSMAEAGELAHWEILAKLNETPTTRTSPMPSSSHCRSSGSMSTPSASSRCAWRPRRIPQTRLASANRRLTDRTASLASKPGGGCLDLDGVARVPGPCSKHQHVRSGATRFIAQTRPNPAPATATGSVWTIGVTRGPLLET